MRKLACTGRLLPLMRQNCLQSDRPALGRARCGPRREKVPQLLKKQTAADTATALQRLEDAIAEFDKDTV